MKKNFQILPFEKEPHYTIETALFVKKLLQLYSECKEEEEGTFSLM